MDNNYQGKKKALTQGIETAKRAILLIMLMNLNLRS